MIRLYFDVHVPLTVAEQVSKRGVDVLRAQADDSATLPDHELLARATSLDRVIVTSDIRFRALAEHWQATGHDFAGLIFGQGNPSSPCYVLSSTQDEEGRAMNDRPGTNRLGYSCTFRGFH